MQIQVYPYDKGARAGDRVVIHAENYGDHYVRDLRMNGWQKHPLLEAAIRRMKVPEDMAIHLTIFSEAPGGASTGTSAAVTVALVGALDRLTPGRLTPHEVAYTAWAIETEELGQQSGIQDQLASAYGGINFIEMFQYPTASVSPIQVSNAAWWELERRLALIFLGKSHSSSHVHEKVIRELEGEGPDSPRLEALRTTAERSRDAVYEGDWAGLGRGHGRQHRGPGASAPRTGRRRTPGRSSRSPKSTARWAGRSTARAATAAASRSCAARCRRPSAR